MKMRYVFLSILLIFLLPILHASSGSHSVMNNHSSRIVGQDLTTSTSFSYSEPMGAIEFKVNYDASKLEFKDSTIASQHYDVSGGVIHIAIPNLGNEKSFSYNFYFEATSRGDTTISTSDIDAIDADENDVSFSSDSAGVSIITQEEHQDTLSSNNDLASLEVVGYELEPEFSANETKYEVQLSPLTETINIDASVADARANARGAGEFSVETGDNQFEIVVTAENGSVKTYLIEAYVPELEAIKIEIAGEKYQIVRVEEDFTCPKFFAEKDYDYDDEEILVCYNEDIEMLLFYLEDEYGEKQYFVYDDGEFTFYHEIIFSEVVFFNLPFPDDITIHDNYSQVKLMINGEEVTAYRYDDNDDFYLIYGKNMPDGTAGLYQYDKEEGTIQRFVLTEVADEEEAYPFLPIILGGLTGLFFIVAIVLLWQFKRARNIIKKLDTPQPPNEEYDDDKDYIAKTDEN